MKSSSLNQKAGASILFFLLITTVVASAYETSDHTTVDNGVSVFDTRMLPPPESLDMILEETIFRRMSVREYTDEPISEQDLSTLLYAAYGIKEDSSHTVAGMNDTNAAVLYVLLEDGAYWYNALEHSLILYKDDDYRNIVGWQYPGAPVVLGLCWNSTLASADFAGVELGEIGQNIAFAANALDLGTVVTGEAPPAIERMGIPEDQEGMIVMPIGHPLHPYRFKNRPFWISLLPKITPSTLSLSDAIEEFQTTTSFSGKLSREQISRLLWSAYGFSPYLDKSEQEKNPIVRHRSVPSAHGYYPLQIYAVSSLGVFFYEANLLTRFLSSPVDVLGIPVVSYMMKIKRGEYRTDLAEASLLPSISDAPLTLVIILDLELAKDLAGEWAYRFWFYEAGAAAHNVMLEAAALDLQTNIASFTDADAVVSLLDGDENMVPLVAVPISA